MKKMSKRVLSIVLAILMVATTLPLGAFTALAGTKWQLLATTDFTEAVYTKSGSSGSYNYANGSGFKPTEDGSEGTYMTWNSLAYGEQSYSKAAGYSGDAARQPCSNSTDGTILSDGVLYLSGYYKNGIAQNKTPITGLSSFKIDFEFKYKSAYSRTNSDNDGFFRISNYSKHNSGNGIMNRDSGDKHYDNTTWFTQGINGKQYYLSTNNNDGGCTTVTNPVSGKYNLSTNSSYSPLSVGTSYHYVLTYAHDTVTSWIEDTNGNIVTNLGSVTSSGFKSDSSYISNMTIGTPGGNYLKNFAVKNVKVYKGVSDDADYEVSEARDKYLFTYFTGNSTEDLHMAVSDDGYNFEALNGNAAVWNSAKLPESKDVYPKTFMGNDVSNVYSNHAITGHVRDPYMFQAEDGSYYCLATDLNTNNGSVWSNNSQLMVWHVDDPEDIADTDPWFIETQRFFSGYGATTIANVDRAWAPEAIWDPYQNAYMMHFGVKNDGSGIYTRLYYTYTKDFKTFTDPKPLLQVGHSNIDANINYDGQKYVLTYKKEDTEDGSSNNKRIYRCTSERPNGPYTNPVMLDTGNDGVEGGETYPVTKADGSLEYTLIMDYFGYTESTFKAFTSSTMTGISTSSENTSLEINHLSPRHGSVVRITSTEYNALVKKYGKQTFAASAYTSGDDVNSKLIARYFTTSDVTYNAVNKEANDLTNYGVTYQYVDGKNAAYFNGSGDAQTALAAKDNANKQYLIVNTKNIGDNDPFANLNVKDGITFDWYSKQSTAVNGNGYRVFEMNDKGPASVKWTSDGSEGHNKIATLYASACRQVGATNHKDSTGAANLEINSARAGSADWHRYTVSVSAGYVHYFIDGEMVAECPKTSAAISNNWLDCLRGDDGQLMFGITAYKDDNMFNGYISDFRIYEGALAPTDIEKSIDKLENITISSNENDFYDPMEDKTVDGNTYTAYSPGTIDTENEHGKVLSYAAVNGAGQTAHDTYKGAASDSGYVISFWYNPGTTVQEETVFHIGDATNYINFKENEILDFKYGDTKFRLNWAWCNSSGRGSGLIDTGWHHYILRVVPAGNYDKLYFYVDGVYADSLTTSSIAYNTAFSDKNYIYCWGDATVNASYSVSGFLANNGTMNVHYGKGSGYSSAGDGFIDDFRIYTELHSAEDVYKNDSSQVAGATLDEAIDIYEHRIAAMANSGYSAMYTNLSAAYTAYKAAVAAKATSDTSDDATALTNLNTALGNMKKFVPYTGTNTPSFCNEAGYYNNVVYTGGATDGAHAWNENVMTVDYTSHASFWKYGTYAYLYYPNSVLLYDGVSDPVIPVMAGFINRDDRYAVEILNLAEQMEDFTLTQNRWQGYTDTTEFAWPSGGSDQMTTVASAEDKNDGMWTINEDVSNDQNIYRTVKNGFKYTGTPTASYTCISQTNWSFKTYHDYLGDYVKNQTITNNVPDIDIINYKKLTDALKNASNDNTNKGYLSDLKTKYQKNGLEGLFAAFDSATSLDPNTGSTYFNHPYTYNAAGETAMDDAALLCGNDINASVVLLGDIRITNDNANYDRLCAAISAYETAMQGMTKLHTNLEAAYNAYLIAVEYKDAYDYGQRANFENPTLAMAAQNLEYETKNMKSYDSITWDGKAAFNNNVIPDSDAIAAGKTDNAGFNNILYCSLATTWITRNWNGADYQLGTPTTSVIVDDGNATPSLPVGFTIKKGGNDQYIYYIRMPYSSCQFELRDIWRGYLDNYNSKYLYNTSGYNTYDTANYSYSSSYGMKHNNRNTPRKYNNKMFYTGTGGTTSNGSPTDYYKLIDNIAFGVVTRGKYNPGSEYINTDNGESLGKVYVVNYAPLKNKIANISTASFSNGIDVKKYREGGLSECFHNVDKLTGIDPNEYEVNKHPNGYTYSQDVTEAVSDCVGDIYNAMKETSDASSTSVASCTVDSETKGDIYDSETGELKPIDETNNGAYTNLKIAILEANTEAPKEQGCILSNPWGAYNTALANARTAMSKIANADASNQYTGKAGYTEQDINNLAKALDNAINALDLANNSAHPLKFSYKESGTHDFYYQCHTNNLHIVKHAAFTEDPDDVDETVISADGTAYDALNMVYKTLDTTKYKNFGIIESGKATFDAVQTATFDTSTEDMLELSEQLKAQKIVDDGITALMEAIETSNKESDEHGDPYTKSFNSTFNVYIIGADNKQISETPAYTYTDAYTYGSTPKYDLTDDNVLTALKATDTYSGMSNEELIEALKVDRWEVNGRRINLTSTDLTVNNQGGTTVNVYIKAPSESKNVVIYTLANNPYHTINVTDLTQHIVISSSNLGTITIGSSEYTIPTSSLSYEIAGWNINGTVYTNLDVALSEIMGSNDSINIKPSKQSKRITPSETYTFKLDNAELSDGAVPYDYHMHITANQQLATENGAVVAGIIFYNTDADILVPVTYGTDYRFFVNRGMDFYTLLYVSAAAAVNNPSNLTQGYYFLGGKDQNDNAILKKITDEETIFYLDYKMPMVYSYSEPTGAADKTGQRQDGTTYSNQWTTRSAFTAQVGGSALYGAVTITECGTLNSQTNGREDNLIVENIGNGVSQKINSERDPESNQFSRTLSTTKTQQITMYTRAYVKYSYVYKGKTIDAIAYGPVCASYYGA